MTAIPNGIDPTDLQPVADLPRLRARYAEPDERLILLVGRLVYEKGFHLALDALPGLIERLGNVRFLVAGSGTAEAELKAQAKRLGLMEHGSFVGWTGDDELHSLYRIADLCLVPSIYEPFGLVALEAMASGCPCIVADTGGLREVVPGGAPRRPALPRHATPARWRGWPSRSSPTTRCATAWSPRRGEHVLRFDWADVARQTAGVYGERDSDAASARPRRSRPPRRRDAARPRRAPRARRSGRPSPTATGRARDAAARAPASRRRAPGGSASETIAQSPTVASAPTATRVERDDHAALAEPRPRADLDGRRPPPRSGSPAPSSAAVAEPDPAAAARHHARAAPDAHVAAGLQAPRARRRSRASRRREASRAPRGGTTASAPIGAGVDMRRRWQTGLTIAARCRSEGCEPVRLPHAARGCARRR